MKESDKDFFFVPLGKNAKRNCNGWGESFLLLPSGSLQLEDISGLLQEEEEEEEREEEY